jgi:hypothetical protein
MKSDLTKQFKEDLDLVKKEFEKDQNSYLLSYCIYVGVVDSRGEVTHVTGVQSLEPDSLLGRLEMAKHRVSQRYFQVQDGQKESLEESYMPEVDDLLKQFQIHKKDKPN